MAIARVILLATMDSVLNLLGFVSNLQVVGRMFSGSVISFLGWNCFETESGLMFLEPGQ